MFNVKVSGQLKYEDIIKSINKKIDNASAVIYNELAKNSFQFTPRLNDGLIDSLKPIIENGQYIGIEYTVPYAKRLYFGVDFNFTKNPNPLARALWVREAWRMYKSKILKAAQGAL